ncbi:MAG: cation:proton antiporter [Bacteroidales bacterium]|nr:cation:proton antiporter [Bacteroidales bacterium]
MDSLPSLITDLGVIVILGSLFALICKWLKQPVVLGYIIAGFIAGPHFHLFQTVQQENISTWADIGVIFLLFGMGLDFSFKKLFTIGKIGSKAIGFVIIALGLTGFFAGKLLGWNPADSILLGAMLVMSSTAMIVKSLTDMGYSKEKFAQIVFGILIFDDLFAILVMVILSTFAASAQFSGMQLAAVLVRLIFFIVIWIVVGIFLIPTFLNKTKRHLNDEILLLIAVGLCLAMVMLSVKVGFSSALGAFVMGSILAETLDQERISRVVAPLKDFFGMIFFVSVGMMVDPAVLASNIKTILIISLIPIVCKTFFYIVGVRLAGENLETSIRAGFSMSQMGEFSFIVAQTGIALGLISPQVYPVAIAVSVLTTFITPYSIRLGEPVYNLVSVLLPYEKHKRLYDARNSESTATEHSLDKTECQKSDWSQYIKSYFSRLALYSIICIALLLISFNMLLPLTDASRHSTAMRLVFAAATLVVMAPILRGMIHNTGKQAYLYLTLYTDSTNNRFILSFFTTLRYVAAIFFAFMVITKYSHVPSWVDVIAAIVFFALIFNSKRLLRYNWRIESRFVKNFNARQIVEQSKKTKSKLNELDNLHWIDSNMYLAEYLVTENGKLNGKSLKQLDFRKEYNVLVISVKRTDGREYSLPDGDFSLSGGDILYMLGTLGSLRRLDMDDDSVSLDYTAIKTLNDFNVEQKNNASSLLHCLTFQIESGSDWIGKSLIDSTLMKDKCMVIAIERNDTPIINPSSQMKFCQNDTVWVIGDKNVIYKLMEKNYFHSDN